MATWHQKRNKAPLYHNTLWTVVSDPPNRCRALSLFRTEAGAQEYLSNLERLGKADHCYILPPGGRP